MDAENLAEDKRFGRQRIQEILVQHRGSPREFADSLLAGIQDFIQDSPQFDDMCLVCIQRVE